MSVLASYGSRVKKADILETRDARGPLKRGSLPVPSETVNLLFLVSKPPGKLNLVVRGACGNCLGNLHVVSMDF